MKKITKRLTVLLTATCIVPILGCAGCKKFVEVDYVPKREALWPAATPMETGLEKTAVDTLYSNAAQQDTIRSLLILKDGKLIAEAYFNDGSIDQKARIQSVTKSVTSTLMGIAIDRGFVGSENDLMLEYFPLQASSISDPRKRKITIRHLLQMRSGYPWEESHPDLWNGLLSGRYLPLIEAFPLSKDPGTEFQYSNLSSNWLGIIIHQQTGSSLLNFAEKSLFMPLEIEPGEWGSDWDGHNNGCGDLHLTARDMVKFGQLYLNDGKWGGVQIVPEGWVEDSLKSYSKDAWKYRVGSNFRNIGYGYQWWSITAGNHRYNLAWGHGGQQIAVIHDLNMVIVVTAYPFWLEHNDKSWKYEKQNLNLTADFIASLP